MAIEIGKPRLEYWRAYVDGHGVSHQDRREITDFERQNVHVRRGAADRSGTTKSGSHEH
ncbi:MAG TPA: hypothetical protein VFY97_00980 [Rhodanobacteraceae bacterium]|nr:hypothetical protein [Rhodanobacteraceae bacterium]